MKVFDHFPLLRIKIKVYFAFKSLLAFEINNFSFHVFEANLKI